MNDTTTPTDDGFRDTVAALDFPPSPQWVPGLIVQGTIEAIHNVKVDRDGEPTRTRLMVLDSPQGKIGVWDCAGLSVFFDNAKVREEVRITQVGDKKIPGKPTPMRVFKVQVRRG